MIKNENNKSMKIDVLLYRDETGAWIAEVPSIPGCGSDGKTRDQALENVRDAIDLCQKVREDLRLPEVELVTIEIPAA